MARTIDATGRSIDEAIFNGLKELEISIDEVEIDIIQQESKGILGIGAKPAIVRLTEREPEDIVLPEYLNPENQRRERSDRRDKRERRDKRDRRERTERTERAEGSESGQGEEAAEGAEGKAAELSEERPRRERDRRDRRRKGDRERSDRREPKEPPEGFTAEAAQGNPAAEFLKGLLEHMKVEGTVLAKEEEEGVRLYIDKSTMGMLIGHRGETLDAMQYLTSLAVNRNRKQEGYTRVSIDTEGYREKREETLARLARKIAGQVKATGRSRTLEPMNPYERRVLHATLQNHPHVATRSEGEEPNRRVVIYLKDKAE
ncbi:MAG: Jag N-terminal domain-containing protein [Clostridia bacterium]|nr:Jag N-terminal domain-containing protein [Clostridia bacterium]MBQ6704338.1 Jag N-terminal domain-containing protein [Clostridia bacterium]